MKFLHRRWSQVRQVLVTNRAFCKVAQLRAGLLPPRGRGDGESLLSNNDAFQRVCPLHDRRNRGVQLFEARHADSVRCCGMCCRDGNGGVMNDMRWIQQSSLGGTSIAKYPAAPPAMLNVVSGRLRAIPSIKAYMLKTESDQQLSEIGKECNSLCGSKS
jgi:hypothetical protein